MVLIIPKLKALNNMSSLSSVLVKEYSNEIVEKSCLREVIFLVQTIQVQTQLRNSIGYKIFRWLPKKNLGEGFLQFCLL